MRCLAVWILFIAVGAAVVPRAVAQQAVQLPTFSQFSTSTTVSVPDRGSAFMGGINRSSSGRNSFRSPLLPFRPFRNTAIGSEQSAMNMHVSAWIHDFEAMDEYLLGQPARTVQGGPIGRNFTATDPRPAGLDPAWNPAGRSGAHVAAARPSQAQWQPTREAPPAVSLLSVDDERRRREVQAENRSSEAQAFFLRGQEAEAAGKANVARIYYQMAARRATGEFQNEILARLRATAHPEAEHAVAAHGPR